jgi:hypothetical protein
VKIRTKFTNAVGRINEFNLRGEKHETKVILQVGGPGGGLASACGPTEGVEFTA